ncbi:helix-turn-helix domain-containing protein [Treponema sp.]|uniref:helix-turn-helix domain-containing protein n=1 Tax=Treponema sp. TaxID=166 RepID=UPI00388F14C7
MKYVTGEKVFCDGFTMEVQMFNELLLPEETDDFYSIMLFRGMNLQVSTATGDCLYDQGLLVLSPRHGIKEIKIMDSSEESSVQTLVFSAYGLNTNNRNGFPDSFEYSFMNELKSSYVHVRPVKKLFDTFVEYFENINQHLNVKQGHLWPCIARSYISELIILLTRNKYSEEEEKKCDGEVEEKVSKVIEYFQYSYSKKITLDEVSRKFATNRTTLNSMFNKAFGVSAIAYLNRMRIQNATMMLTNTGMPISDIAERAGFADESYFSRAYKKMTGKSPSEFRLSIPHPDRKKWPESAL